MKKIIITISLILLIGIVIAQGVGNIIPADFSLSSSSVETRYKGEITFLANGKSATCYLNEPNLEIDDEFEECIRNNYPNMRITNVKDWTNRDYKQVEVDGKIYRSFDEEKLNQAIKSTGNNETK